MRRAKTAAAYQERKRTGKVREIGSTDTCKNCGKPYTVTGGLQKYCKECAPEMMLALDREQGLEYYNKNKDRTNPIRNAARRKENFCKTCGKQIPTAGGRIFCLDCEKEGKRKMYAEQYVDRNITRRGRSYIVRACTNSREYYIGATMDKEAAFRLRELAESKIKAGCFLDWLKKFRENK